MFEIPFWMKAAILAAVISVSAFSGFYVEHLRWNSADAQAKLASEQRVVELLKKNLRITSEVLQVDSRQAVEDAKTVEDIERITDELASKASDRPCLDAATVDGLRRQFGR